MNDLCMDSLSREDKELMEALDEHYEQISLDGASSSVSVDGLSWRFSLGDTPCEHGPSEDGASTSNGSSPFRWPLNRSEPLSSSERCFSGAPLMAAKSAGSIDCTLWEAKREKRETELSEVEMMKEKFAKLLLGEDMSGGGNGVCTALAISNAITNLSASVFGELWRLQPLSSERKTMWRREIEWLLCVAYHIVELVPSCQTFQDGSTQEIMISRPRSDLQINLPALRKLDTMLLESLDSFTETEFWYVDHGITMADEEIRRGQRFLPQRQEKWWLPSPKLTANGLSDKARKQLQHQRECISQILKAALAINSQTLLEMEVPDVYWEALPKNGKAALGERIYKHIVSEGFLPEALLCSLDLSTEHNVLEIANRIEAAFHVWRRRKQYKATQVLGKEPKHNTKTSWGMVKDFVSDVERREVLAGRAESLLLCLKQRFPGLPQTILDVTKIQYNRDIGQSVLESYSRVMESLAFNILARIEDIIYIDDIMKHSLSSPPVKICLANLNPRRSYSLNIPTVTPFATPLVTPSVSPSLSPSPQRPPNSPSHHDDNPCDTAEACLDKALTDLVGLGCSCQTNQTYVHKKSLSGQANKTWSDARTFDTITRLRQPTDDFSSCNVRER